MSRHRSLIIGLLAAVAVLVGAAASLALSSPPTVVTEKQDGKTVTISRGKDLDVRLKSCAGSCGYHWATVHKPSSSVLKLVYTKTEDAPTSGSPPAPGRPQQQVNRYRGVAKGTTSLKLGYVGPGQGAKVEDAFSLKVRVK